MVNVVKLPDISPTEIRGVPGGRGTGAPHRRPFLPSETVADEAVQPTAQALNQSAPLWSHPFLRSGRRQHCLHPPEGALGLPAEEERDGLVHASQGGDSVLRPPQPVRAVRRRLPPRVEPRRQPR